jgi:FKBP-type peptidyl-prolyl cis-trans isomerase
MKSVKPLLTAAMVGLLSLPLTVSAADSAADKAIESTKDKVSYSIGLDLGTYLTSMKGKVDFDILKQGLDDGFMGVEPKLSKEEMTAAQEEFAATVKAEQAAVMEEMKEKNSAAGALYLEENKKKEGVVTTDSGLQYEVLEEGEGEMPTAEDTVKVDYVGTLIDGTEFDSSIKRGEPVTFPVGQVIPGWTEALQQMKVGSKHRVVIPAELAYGEAGAPPVIEPNSVLVFEIKLLGIEQPAEEGTEAPAVEAEDEKKSE